MENRDLFAEGVPPSVSRNAGAGLALLKKTHQTICKVTEDIGKRFHLNTAISSIMELYNLIRREKDSLRLGEEGRTGLRLALESMIVLLAPFTPHISEELWERTGHRDLLARYPWPAFDPELAKEERVTIVIQVNGKLRDKFEADATIDETEMKERALGLDRIRSLIAGRPVRKVICSENRLVNIVV